MPPPRIAIVGAGLSGLVLGRCLLRRGIASNIFEKDTARAGSARYGYGITLQPSAYYPLLEYLGLDDRTFRRRLAVDTSVGGDGKSSGDKSTTSEFRANRQRLEQLLKEGLDVRWDHRLSGIQTGEKAQTLHFENGQQAEASLIISAEGPHSSIRKTISPATEIKVLPYAVYNGKRRISEKEFEAVYASYFTNTNVIERRASRTLLQISLNDRTDSEVSISYTYSRPGRNDDPVFNPDRPNSGAKTIPEGLFQEVATLSDLEGPFKEVFNPEKMQQDRMLNWLMRSVSVDINDLTAAARQGVIMIGDAVHATPILGGNGANAAITDGIELAEFVAEHGTSDLDKFYEGRLQRWQEDIKESERRLAKMHEHPKASL